MDAELLFFLLAGAAAGGFINGLAGTGTALFSLGWWLQVMPPRDAVALVLFLSVASGIQGLWVVRHNINWPRFLRFILPALVGMPIGFQLLALVSPTPLKIVVAAFLIGYGLFFAFRADLPNLQRGMPKTDMGVGFFGGILGSFAGLSGALPSMYCALRPWPKVEQRAVLQPYNFIVLGLSGLVLATDGAYHSSVITMMTIALPVAIICAFLGIRVYRMITDNQFRRLLILLMLVSGVVIIFREGLSHIL